MLSAKENKRLTRVGPGTPMGDLLRQYWHPIGASEELRENPTKSVRVLGESLVLYRDRSGTLGLLQESCPHRRVNLLYGIPEAQGLRCPYHGWRFDETGRCLEMPAEAPDSTFKDRVTAVSYPVQEAGGLVFAYLGPSPAPVLPLWGPLAWENVARDIAITELPCNWLQCQENSLDPVHTEWLHRYQSNWVRERSGVPRSELPAVERHKKIGFDVTEYGVIKRRVMEGGTEEDDLWKVGHPIIFPNILQVGSPQRGTLQFRVPMDDTHTYHVSVYTFRAAPGADVAPQERVPYYHVPLYGDDGRLIISIQFNQDYMAWITQGPLADRTKEKLGESDKGVILFRRMLKQQMEIVQDGGEPMNVIHEGSGAAFPELPLEPVRGFGHGSAPRKYVPQEAGESKAHADIEKVLATYVQAAVT